MLWSSMWFFAQSWLQMFMVDVNSTSFHTTNYVEIFVFLYFLMTCMSNKRIKWYITFNTSMVVNVLGVVIFFICIIVIHVMQGFVMFCYVNKFHNSTHGITLHFVRKKAIFVVDFSFTSFLELHAQSYGWKCYKCYFLTLSYM
jgi:hypothetical protein